MYMYAQRALLAALFWFAVVATIHAAEHRVPPPRELAEVEAVLAEAKPADTKRTLNVVLLAGPKDHGLFEHDYPLWQKRWKVLLGGMNEGDQPVLNTFGEPIPVDQQDLAGAENVEISTAWIWPTAEQWETADLIVMYSAPAWIPEHLAELQRFLKRGGGFVVMHMAMWQDSPELAALIGLGKQPQTIFRHGPLRLRLTSPQHDITRGLPSKINVIDESYFNFQGDESSVQVLATSPETRPGEEQQRDEPMFWTFERDAGRVFVCVPGHYMWTFDDPYFRILLLRGMAWAAGESPFRFDPLVLRGARVLQAAETEEPRASDADLSLWLDAGDRDSMEVDADGHVSAWKNKAAGGQCLTATGDQRPQWVPEGIGTRPALRFDGVDDVVKDSDFSQSASNWTIFLVVKPESNRGSGIQDGFRGFFSSNEPNRRDFLTGLSIGMGGQETERFSVLNVEGSKGSGAGNLLYAESDFGVGRVLVVASDNERTTLFAESEIQLSRTASEAPTSFAEIRVGARYHHQNSESGFLHGDLAEVLLYRERLPESRIKAISQHLETKYDVASVLNTPAMPTLDDAFATLATYDWGQSRENLAVIDKIIRNGDRDAIANLESRLVAALEQDLSLGALDYVCRRLEMIGTEPSVEALAALLSDERRAAIASRALQEIPSPQASQALVNALPYVAPSVQPDVIQALAARQEKAAVQPLIELVESSDDTVANSAAAALSNIGDERAVQPLLDREGTSAEDLLTLAADLVSNRKIEPAEKIYQHLEGSTASHIKSAVLAGRVAARPEDAPEHLIKALGSCNRWLVGHAASLMASRCSPEIVEQVVERFDMLPPGARRVVLRQGWSRLPAQGRSAALQAIASDNLAERTDGIRLLETVGDAADVAQLASIAADASGPALRESARLALSHISADGVNKALLSHLQEAPGAEQLEVIRALRDRRTPGAIDPLLALVDSEDKSLRMAAIEALQVLGNASTIRPLLPRLLEAAGPEERDAIERALWLCAQHEEDEDRRLRPFLDAYENASEEDRAKLLPLLGRLGGDMSLQVIHAARQNADAETHAAVVRALSNWPDATVASELLKIARNDEHPAHRIWALRGYLRVVTLPDKRPARATLELIEPALELIDRPHEQRLLLSRLPAVVCPESLKLAMKYVEDPVVGSEAIAAAAKLSEALLPDHAEVARDAMAEILDVTTDPVLRVRLERAISKPE